MKTNQNSSKKISYDYANNKNNEMAFYLKDAITTPLTPAEELNLIIQAQKGDSAAENMLIKCFTYYVLSIINEYTTEHLDKSDLFAVGQYGLALAIRKFDIKSGRRLSTFANHWIRKTVLDEIYDTEKNIRIPQNVQAEIRLYNNYKNNLPETLTESEKIQKTNSSCGLSQKRIKNLKNIPMFSLSLDEMIGDDPDSETYMSELEDTENPNPDQCYEAKELKRNIYFFKKNLLSKRQSAIFDARAGFGYKTPLSLQETADLLGISKSTVRDEEEKIKKLAKSKKAVKYFEGYVA